MTHQPRFHITTTDGITTAVCETCEQSATSNHRPVVDAWIRAHTKTARTQK